MKKLRDAHLTLSSAMALAVPDPKDATNKHEAERKKLVGKCNFSSNELFSYSGRRDEIDTLAGYTVQCWKLLVAAEASYTVTTARTAIETYQAFINGWLYSRIGGLKEQNFRIPSSVE